MHQRRRTFQIRVDGRSWAGEWWIADERIHVSSEYGVLSLPKDIRKAGVKVLAEMMLREIVTTWLEQNAEG